MRVLMAIVLFAGSILALSATADAARKYKRMGKPQHSMAQSRARERLECERARNEDPTGQYAGFPCWARETFGRSNKSWD